MKVHRISDEKMYTNPEINLFMLKLNMLTLRITYHNVTFITIFPILE